MRQTGDSGFQFPKKWICLWWQCVEFGVFRFVQRKLQLCPETGGQGRVLQAQVKLTFADEIEQCHPGDQRH